MQMQTCRKKRILRMASWILTGSWLLSLPVSAEEAPEHETCSPEQEQYIWNFLLDLTDNPRAVAGIMGNLSYESDLQTTRLEKGKQCIYSEDSYTKAVDSGEYTEFTEDGIGYGIAQWSYPSRKQRLLELSLSADSSVGDLDVQLQLLEEELIRYHMLNRISNADSVRFASDYFLLNFENPNLTDEEMKKLRSEIGNRIYDQYSQKEPVQNLQEIQKHIVEIASATDLYGICPEDNSSLTWVKAVYEEAGIPIPEEILETGEGHSVCDFKTVPPGAIVFGETDTGEKGLGIYLGNNKICQYQGRIQIDPGQEWLNDFSSANWILPIPAENIPEK